MTTAEATDRLRDLPLRADEDPFTVAVGGFYRRWFNLLDDIGLLKTTVAELTDTVDEEWVPVWSRVARQHADQAEEALSRGGRASARRGFLQAKTYYSIGRFPSPYHSGTSFAPATMGPLKSECYQRYLECFARASELSDVGHETVSVTESGLSAAGYLYLPPGASATSPVPGVLVMCGADMFKEDREHYALGAIGEGLAALVVDGPGTGQTTFPHAPESIVAWQKALDLLESRPEVVATRLGAFGVSRGGQWVLRLAALDHRVKAVASIAPSGVGYEGSAEERAAWREFRNARAKHWFGPGAERPAEPEKITEEQQRADFLRWSLKHNGLLEQLHAPSLLINGKKDHLSPIGELYLALESGPPTSRTARVYEDDGHIAARSEPEWGPATWSWMRQQLTG
ncbi:MAG TPA: alpha/beta hydrolase [Nocardioidaceae bacterium]|nr:alpha/beta hydrolase [Nocardioidaceae bacterium]